MTEPDQTAAGAGPAVEGRCDPRFEALRERLAANLAGGADLGASLAVTVDGEVVVDLWGGWADRGRTRAWTADTITNVWSTTKTMTALCALILADAGDLEVDAPVDRYWPEFAAGGKGGRVLVRHLLGHTAGLCGLTEPIVTEDFYDWDKITSLLAAQEPWWEPGTASGYHAMTQGYLVGEVVRRITGQSLGRFFREQVAGPLGADFHIGLDPADDDRVAPVIPPGRPDPGGPRGDLTVRTMTNPLVPAAASAAPEWRRAEIPAANGHGHARSVATIQAVLANRGEVGGVRLLSAAGCERALIPQSDGVDRVLGYPVRFGLGFALASGAAPFVPPGRAGYWGGWGGSLVVIDLDTRMTVAYAMNRMLPGIGDARGQGLIEAAFAAVAC